MSFAGILGDLSNGAIIFFANPARILDLKPLELFDTGFAYILETKNLANYQDRILQRKAILFHDQSDSHIGGIWHVLHEIPTQEGRDGTTAREMLRSARIIL